MMSIRLMGGEQAAGVNNSEPELQPATALILTLSILWPYELVW